MKKVFFLITIILIGGIFYFSQQPHIRFIQDEIHLSLHAEVEPYDYIEEVSHMDIEELKIDSYTLDDIIDSFIKPNRSPRDNYATPLLKKDILKIEDLKPGMVLEGTVRNVVDFGAFIDIGLKNDGLVHISKISHERIKHPLDKLSIGDIVEVYVIDVDVNKHRVGLSMIKD